MNQLKKRKLLGYKFWAISRSDWSSPVSPSSSFSLLLLLFPSSVSLPILLWSFSVNAIPKKYTSVYAIQKVYTCKCNLQIKNICRDQTKRKSYFLAILYYLTVVKQIKIQQHSLRKYTCSIYCCALPLFLVVPIFLSPPVQLSQPISVCTFPHATPTSHSAALTRPQCSVARPSLSPPLLVLGQRNLVTAFLTHHLLWQMVWSIFSGVKNQFLSAWLKSLTWFAYPTLNWTCLIFYNIHFSVLHVFENHIMSSGPHMFRIHYLR